MATHDMPKPINKEVKMSNTDWNSQTNEVVKWLMAKNYSVSFLTDTEDRVDFVEKRIYINSRNHPETKYYTLLHECGHVLISKDSQFQKDMPMYADSPDGRKARSVAYRVSTVAEEIEAWKRGRRLAQRLSHYINDSKYDTSISNGVMSYILWAADGGGTT